MNTFLTADTETTAKAIVFKSLTKGSWDRALNSKNNASPWPLWPGRALRSLNKRQETSWDICISYQSAGFKPQLHYPPQFAVSRYLGGDSNGSSDLSSTHVRALTEFLAPCFSLSPLPDTAGTPMFKFLLILSNVS